jgi:hypothetical protein
MDHYFTDPMEELKRKGRIVLAGHPQEPDFLYIVRALNGTEMVFSTEAATIDEALDLRDHIEGIGYSYEIEPIEDAPDGMTWTEAA